jgi:signal recognition particle GTPase
LRQLESLTAVEEGAVAQLQRALQAALVFLESDLQQVGVILEFRSIARKNPTIAEQVSDFNEEVLKIICEGLTRVLGPMTDRLALPIERIATLLLVHLHGTTIGLLFATSEEERERIRESFLDMGRMLTHSMFREVS